MHLTEQESEELFPGFGAGYWLRTGLLAAYFCWIIEFQKCLLAGLFCVGERKGEVCSLRK